MEDPTSPAVLGKFKRRASVLPVGVGIECAQTSPQIPLQSLGSQVNPIDFRHKTGIVGGVAAHPNGVYAASGAECEFIVWNLHTCSLEKKIEADGVTGHKHVPKSYSTCSFSQDSLYLLTSAAESIKIWTVGSWVPLFSMDLGKEDSHPSSFVVRAALFHPHDSSIFATCGGSLPSVKAKVAEVRVWQWSPDGTVKCLQKFSGMSEQVNMIAWSPDGKSIACVAKTEEDNVKIWHWDHDSPNTSTDFNGYDTKMWGVAFSPNGKRLIACSGGANKTTGMTDHTVRLWNTETGSLLLTLTGHKNMVMCCAFSPCGNYIYSGSADCSVIKWDACTGTLLYRYEDNKDSGGKNMVMSLTTSKDVVVTGSSMACVCVINVLPGVLLSSVTAHSSKVNALATSWDGEMFATAADDCSIKIFSTRTGVEIITLAATTEAASGHTKPVLSVTFTRDNQRVLTTGSDNLCILWDISLGMPVLVYTGHTAEVKACDISPCGSFVASCAAKARIWNTEDGADLTEIDAHDKKFGSIVFSPCGKYIVTAGEDKTICVWRADTEGSLTKTDAVQTISGAHLSAITRLFFSYPEEEGARVTMLSGSADCTVKMWDWDADAGALKQSGVLSGHASAVVGVGFTFDGEMVVTASNQYLRVWQNNAQGTELPAYKVLDSEKLVTAMSLTKLDGIQLAVVARSDGTAWVLGPFHRARSVEDIALVCLKGSAEDSTAMMSAFPSSVFDRNPLEHEQTLAHALADNGMARLLAHCLEVRSPSPALLTDSRGYCCLDVAMYHNNFQCVQVILDHLIDTWDTHPISSREAFTRAIPGLARDFPELLEKFFDDLWIDNAPLTVMENPERPTHAVDDDNMFRPSEEVVPAAIWPKPPKDAKAFHVVPQVVGLPNIAGRWAALPPRQGDVKKSGKVRSMKLVDSPLHVIVDEGLHHVLGSRVMRSVLDWKWQAFGKTYFQREFALYFFYLVLFTGLSLSAVIHEFDTLGEMYSDAHGVFRAIFEVVFFLINLRYLVKEYKQVYIERLGYFSSIWNYLDVSGCTLVIVAFILRFAESPSEQPVLAVLALILWFKAMSFGRGFRSVGIFVIIILDICRDMTKFMYIMIGILLGFAHAYYLLFRGIAGNYRYVPQTIMNMFRLLLGDYDWDGDHEDSTFYFFLELFFVLFMVMVVIIMLNLLIALMGDSYAQVQAVAESKWRLDFGSIIVDAENMLDEGKKNDPLLFPTYLHLLNHPQSDADDDEDRTSVWQRFSEALEKVQERQQQLREKVFDLQRALPKHVVEEKPSHKHKYSIIHHAITD